MSGLADYGNTENNPICTKGQSLQNVEVWRYTKEEEEEEENDCILGSES